MRDAQPGGLSVRFWKVDVIRNQNGRGSASRWELWNLRALFPRASQKDLVQLKNKRRQIERFESRAMATLAERSADLFAPGRRFLASHPELSCGMILTMHLGPYQFLPEPFLYAGIRPAVLLNQQAYARLRAQAEHLRSLLHLAGRLEWLPISDRMFVRRMITALREGRPLLVFLDGNSGLGGSLSTREKGMRYRLPGREIRVRTGLARLIRKIDCPVHGVVLLWDAKGSVVWHQANDLIYDASDSPEAITHGLYDWGFREVLKAPEQWGYWDMLKESYACFATSKLANGLMPPAVREDFCHAFAVCLSRVPETVRVELIKEVEVWPGDVLANLSEDCFYAAEGLLDADVAELRGRCLSLSDLCHRFGPAWVRFHILRLCLLEMARLRGI